MNHVDASNPAVQAILRELGYSVVSGKSYHSKFAILAGWRNKEFGTEEVGHGDHSDACYGEGLNRVCDGDCDEKEAWAACLRHAESEEGLERNFAKVAAMLGNYTQETTTDGRGEFMLTHYDTGVYAIASSPQVAAWRLLLLVRGIA